MGNDANEPGGRDFTRAEFLGVGLTAGAGATVYGPHGADPFAPRANATRRAPPCKPSDPPTKALPLKHLSALWSHLLPRVAAAHWCSDVAIDKSGLEWPSPGDDLWPYVVSWVDWIQNSNNGDFKGSVGFQEVVNALGTFAGNGDKLDVRFAGEAGYDFYLSEEGMDLYIPTGPTARPDPTPPRSRLGHLLWYFTLRESGRPVLGMPGIDAEYIMPAKIGASQLRTIALEELKQLLNINGDELQQFCAARDGAYEITRGTIQNPTLEDGEKLDVLRGLVIRTLELDQSVLQALEQFVEAWSGAGPADREGVLVDAENTMRAALGDPLRAPSADADAGGQPTAAGERQQVRTCTPMTADQFECLKRSRLCWQMEGSVFRGVAEQFPRSIALHWFSTTPGNSFKNRYREAMMDRLETYIDEPSVMWFDEGNRLASWPSDWDDQIVVTDRGIHFPVVTSPSKATGETDEDPFLREVVKGRAGNPVFTDTRLSI